MPDVTSGIVNAETLASMGVGANINLVQNASIQYHLHDRVRDDGGWTIDIKDVPIADPKIELPKRR